ncbi:hypothetical protein PCURB6_17260 [Paenibacillus curdlanolyticus]|nr:hypothetical protein PCURB6_17260 [Paenibacillus curdlanolyticus]
MNNVSGVVDFVTRTAKVTIDSPEVSINDVVHKIESLGYQAVAK